MKTFDMEELGIKIRNIRPRGHTLEMEIEISGQDKIFFGLVQNQFKELITIGVAVVINKMKTEWAASKNYSATILIPFSDVDSNFDAAFDWAAKVMKERLRQAVKEGLKE
jgi:hypothetical protein